MVLGVRKVPQAETKRMRRCHLVMRQGWGRLGREGNQKIRGALRLGSEGNQKIRGAEEGRGREKGPALSCKSCGRLLGAILQQSQIIRLSLQTPNDSFVVVVVVPFLPPSLQHLLSVHVLQGPGNNHSCLVGAKTGDRNQMIS